MARGRHRAELDVQPALRQFSRPMASAAVGVLVFAASLGIGTTHLVGDDGAATRAMTVDDSESPSQAATRLGSTSSQASVLQARERIPATRERALPSSDPSTPAPVVIGQRWVATGTSVHSGPSPAHAPTTYLVAYVPIDVTGVIENAWSQVVVDGALGWVDSANLSDSQPVPPTPRATATPGLSGAPCSISRGIESGLTENARAVYRAVCAAHGDSVSSFGGYRAGDPRDHGTGRAVDITVSGEDGWRIARFLQVHAAQLDITYLIYQQQSWRAGNPANRWSPMADRGNPTANHFDHVHVSVS